MEIKEDAQKNFLNLMSEEKELKTDSEDFESKINEAKNLVKKLKEKSDEADTKLSSISSQIFSLKSNKENIENRIDDLKEKIIKSETQIPQFNLSEDEKNFENNNQKLIEGKEILEEKNKLLVSKKNEYEIIKKTLTDLYKEKNEADNKINLNRAEFNSLSSLLGHNSSNNETLEKSIDNYASLEKSIGSILGETLLAPVLSNLDSKTNTSFWRNNFRSSLQTTLPNGAKPIVDNIKSNSILDIALLGVGVVDNQEKAFQLQNKLSFGQALTTLEGGLWRWDGFVQPPEVQNSYSERLQKLAKLRTLENEIPHLEKNKKVLKKSLMKMNPL